MYTEAQLKIIEKYLKATENDPENRISLTKLLTFKKYISKYPKVVVKDHINESLQEFISEKVERKGRKKKIINNENIFSILSNYADIECAKLKYKCLDDILVGVSRLHLDNSSGTLSIATIYYLLSSFKVITTDTIIENLKVGVRHAQKILSSVSIANRMLEKEIKRLL